MNPFHTTTRFLGLQPWPAALFLILGCQTSGPDILEIPCVPAQSEPYADGIPYLGIHANAANDDVVSCETGSEFTEVWHALEGRGLTQPNTFSPDGRVTYATTTSPDPKGCRLFAVDTVQGDVDWCQTFDPSINLGAVEVDSTGDLYFTAADELVSLSADGEERWRLQFADSEGVDDAPWGLHFTPDGHIATVTSSGWVYLVGREDGRVLDSLSIADTWGFVAPATMDLEVDITPLLPVEVVEDIESVWGETNSEEKNGGFGGLLGAGAFCDNTVGIDSQGRIYVIGGGTDEDTGALVQISVEGGVESPRLVKGWYAPTHAGSATTPSISHGDRYVVIGDGSSSDTLLNPERVDARIKVMDIVACDANTDQNPDPAVCAVSYQESLERSPTIGAPAILEDGTVIFWELGLDFSAEEGDRDVVAFGPDGVVWDAALPDAMDWVGVITVTDNHIIGTASTVEPSEHRLFDMVFPQTTDDYVVVLNRDDGSLLWKHSIPDDGAATVSVGPDGSLYVGMMGFLSILSVDDRPTLGLIRFAPTAR